ncbi:cyclic nucleotide-binding domain-containing protein [Chryseobacterium sp. ISL-6]|uniref:Crp/Fnr family transcriptional regulator n=1 Tax=Chryseobacterium sp. ISL-6 TaxID=2819143 RepID=UPI001BE83294|nr:cyclic nucleotide-binding domain-containing protein [Chryseobacterium sp. ISL-6]MBT2621934.1 cyclic nucleotide-binding domain-containing protein [Chryseobacterium sp. ISL-6]
MIINENLLLQYSAIYEYYKKNEVIFYDGQFANFYFQILYGHVEFRDIKHANAIISYNYSIGQSFGEFFLFSNKRYLVSAVATTDCIVLKLYKRAFLKLLRDNPEESLKIMRLLAES